MPHPRLIRRRGASAMVYALLVGLISVVAIAAISGTGGSSNLLLSQVASGIAGTLPPPRPAPVVVLPSPSPTPACVSGSQSYTGNSSFMMPAGCGTLQITARGARGGNGNNAAGYNSPGVGGPGGEVIATYSVAPGTSLTLRFGGAGTSPEPAAHGGAFAWVENADQSLLHVAGGGGGSNWERAGRGCEGTISLRDGFLGQNADNAGNGGAGGPTSGGTCAQSGTGQAGSAGGAGGAASSSCINGCGGGGGGGWGGGGAGSGGTGNCAGRSGGGGGCIARGARAGSVTITPGTITSASPSVLLAWSP